MKRNIIRTSDGSTTIHLVDWDEHYHSRHGAIQEARHVFIDHGLSTFQKPNITILEIGFGTGLNALITLLEVERRKIGVSYTGIELFPVSPAELEQLNYSRELEISSNEKSFEKLHSSPWEKSSKITNYFTLTKRKLDFRAVDDKNCYDLIYFDAFGARVQPELWTEFVFKKMFRALKTPGTLVTYAAKGSVRRAMLASGFKIERLAGPPGKREMLRATKTQ